MSTPAEPRSRFAIAAAGAAAFLVAMPALWMAVTFVAATRAADRMQGETTALYATARLWDDGLIDPRDTRKVLAFCLSICREADVRPLRHTTFGVARM